MATLRAARAPRFPAAIGASRLINVRCISCCAIERPVCDSSPENRSRCVSDIHFANPCDPSHRGIIEYQLFQSGFLHPRRLALGAILLLRLLILNALLLECLPLLSLLEAFLLLPLSLLLLLQTLVERFDIELYSEFSAWKMLKIPD